MSKVHCLWLVIGQSFNGNVFATQCKHEWNEDSDNDKPVHCPHCGNPIHLTDDEEMFTALRDRQLPALEVHTKVMFNYRGEVLFSYDTSRHYQQRMLAHFAKDSNNTIIAINHCRLLPEDYIKLSEWFTRLHVCELANAAPEARSVLQSFEVY